MHRGYSCQTFGDIRERQIGTGGASGPAARPAHAPRHWARPGAGHVSGGPCCTQARPENTLLRVQMTAMATRKIAENPATVANHIRSIGGSPVSFAARRWPMTGENKMTRVKTGADRRIPADNRCHVPQLCQAGERTGAILSPGRAPAGAAAIPPSRAKAPGAMRQGIAARDRAATGARGRINASCARGIPRRGSGSSRPRDVHSPHCRRP